jgi:hypothetical protein
MFFMTSPASVQDRQALFGKTHFTFFLALLFHKILEVGVEWFFVWLDRVGTIRSDQMLLDVPQLFLDQDDFGVLIPEFRL